LISFDEVILDYLRRSVFIVISLLRTVYIEIKVGVELGPVLAQREVLDLLKLGLNCLKSD
jgi:hypothetical protein